jgi:hypothetical protein
MREYQPTDVNRRSLKAIPTDYELRFYLELQRAIRDAALKVIDKFETGIYRTTISPTTPTDGETYSPDLFDINLAKVDGDSYHPSIHIDLRLRIPSIGNPDFNPDEEVKY